jgi:hypothetical protein
VGKLLKGSPEFSDRYFPGNTQAGGRLEEHAARHGSTRACRLEFVNIDAALGKNMREVSDNPEMIIADQVERKPAGFWRWCIGAAGGDYYLEPVCCEPLQGSEERRRMPLRHTGAEDTGELSGQMRHPTLQPVTFMGSNDVRQRLHQAWSILAEHR